MAAGDQQRGVCTVGDALASFLRDSGLGPRLRDWKVLDAWSGAIGESLSQRTRPLRFSRGELVVEVDSSAHKHELEAFTGEGYRREANRRLGENRIRRVVFQLKR